MTYSDPQFRSTLTEITTCEPGEWGKKAIRKIADLRIARPHTIELVRETRAHGDEQFLALNCHAFAFGLGTLSTFSVEDGFPSGVFVERWMIPRMIERAEAAVDDVVVYFNEARVAHSGRCVADGRVQSKWAQTGHVWNHGTFEVPLLYGQTVKYFAAPSRAVVEEAYRDFRAAPEHERYPGRTP